MAVYWDPKLQARFVMPTRAKRARCPVTNIVCRKQGNRSELTPEEELRWEQVKQNYEASESPPGAAETPA